MQLTFSPTTTAAFKRAMAVGTRIHVGNKRFPEVTGERVVLPKTNSVDLVTSHPKAPQGSHLAWPKKGGVVHDGDRIWGIVENGEVWLTITVLA